MIGTLASEMTLLMTVGHAEQALVRRQRRLDAHLAALALQAVEQRGLLAADIGAGADALLDVEVRAEHGPSRRATSSAALNVAIACGYSERV